MKNVHRLASLTRAVIYEQQAPKAFSFSQAFPHTRDYVDTVRDLFTPVPHDGTDASRTEARLFNLIRAPFAVATAMAAPVAVPLSVAQDLGGQAVKYPRTAAAMAGVGAVLTGSALYASKPAEKPTAA